LQARADDHTLTTEHMLYKWQEYVLDATDRSGKSLRYERRTGQFLRDAGFVDIQEVVLKLPMSPWPADRYLKDVGRWFNLGFQEGLEAITLGPMTRVMGWSAVEVRNFILSVQKDLNSKSIHGYCDLHIWIARRPL